MLILIQWKGPPLTYTIVFPSEYGCLLPHPPKIPQSLLGQDFEPDFTCDGNISEPNLKPRQHPARPRDRA